MRDRMSARRRTILMLLLLVMFGTLAVGYLLTFHLDTVRRVVQQQMLSAFGPNLRVGEVRVTFFPFPRLTLTDLQILESEQGKPIVEASEIQLNLSFLSVLQDEVIPKGLVIENPKIYLRRNELGQWNINSLLQNRPAGGIEAGAFLAEYSLTIENGTIQIIDALDVTNPETLTLQHVVMHVSNLSAIKPMEVSLVADLNQRGESNLSIQGTISEAQGFFATPLSGEKTTGPQVEVRTNLDLKEGELIQFARLFHIKDFPIQPHGHLQIQGQIGYAPDQNGYALTLSDVIVLTDAINVQGQVNISGLQTEVSPTVSATWTSAPISVTNLLKIVPIHLIPNEIHDAIMNQPLEAKLEVASATLSTSSSPGRKFDLIGEFKVSEGYLDLGKTWGVAEKVQGTVVLNPSGAQLKEFSGIYDSIPVSSGSGEIEFREEGPWLFAELQGQVPSKKLISFLKNLFEWTTPNHAMAGFMGEKGGGELRIRLAGPLDKPAHIAVVQAQYNPQAVMLRLPGIEGAMSNVSGTINFSSKLLNFTSFKGVFQSSPITVEGSINFHNAPAFENFQIGGRVFTKDLQSQFKEFFSPYQEMVSGSATFVSTLSGPMERPRIQTLWNLENLDLNLKGVLRKELKVKGTFNANLEFGAGLGLKAHRMVLAIPPLTLSGNGFFDESKMGQFQASVTASPFEFQSLPAGLTLLDGAIGKGAMEFSLKIDGKGDNWRQWKKDGWLVLSDAVVPVDGLNSPMQNVFVRVKLARHDAVVQRLQFQMQDSEAGIAGSIKNWDSTPQVTFQINAPEFDIDLLVPKGERSPLRDVLETIAATHTVGGNLIFTRAWYKDLQLQNLKGRLRIKNGFVGVDQITGKTDSGSLEGRFLIHLPVRQPATVKTWFKIKDVPFETLQTTFLSAERLDERFWTGTLSMQGMVQGNGNDTRGVFPTLNGDLKILVRDGRIQRGTVIPKMLALMNLPAVLQGKVDLKKDGYPFEKQSATLRISSGIITSEDIFMDGPILKLTGAGTYNLVDDQLDLAVAASPLGAYFDLLEKISLFRILFESEQKNSHIALFDIKGPLKDPVIKPLPLESFKAGLTGFTRAAFNVLKNTVSLPKNILFPKKTEDSDIPPKADKGKGQ
ncbi:AsmA-like C-terminal domain-containing protein [Candidatus Nitronereus thalassa]|uniref:AsmA-like C-terminal domain-containing protein n=1 Tax=Candidatus Nitronereus thalassa TaxID=3020898 RepID=A0ABU3K440_9BACT|nr:AsmA-like C-terminal domain-containing protein [Candidatus Nitronereus thalassa]MDT7041172.1 AsmA-like C-terminal domain-containing protein [Candidatus Nitronereus thalassa]